MAAKKKPAGKAAKNAQWTRHRGGRAPVKPGVHVEVRRRSGEIATFTTKPSSDYFDNPDDVWTHYGAGDDIMAWRRVRKPRQPKAEPVPAEVTAVAAGLDVPVQRVADDLASAPQYVDAKVTGDGETITVQFHDDARRCIHEIPGETQGTTDPDIVAYRLNHSKDWQYFRFVGDCWHECELPPGVDLLTVKNLPSPPRIDGRGGTITIQEPRLVVLPPAKIPGIDQPEPVSASQSERIADLIRQHGADWHQHVDEDKPARNQRPYRWGLVAVCLVVLAGLAFGLMGCTPAPPPEPRREADQCLRAQLFKECLAAVPAGPQVAGKYNDWDEVVDECGSQAYWQSLRYPSQIKPECR